MQVLTPEQQQFAMLISLRSVRFTHTKGYRISEHSELSVSEFAKQTNVVRRS